MRWRENVCIWYGHIFSVSVKISIVYYCGKKATTIIVAIIVAITIIAIITTVLVLVLVLVVVVVVVVVLGEC